MKNFKEKWWISASSGILGKILFVVFGVGVGAIGTKIISVPIDNTIIGAIIFIIGIVIFFLTVGILIYFPDILEWFAYRRQSEIEEIELKNESLKLENENLKLKLVSQRENQLPSPNDEE